MLSYLAEQTMFFVESILQLLFHLHNLVNMITTKGGGNYSLVILIIILFIAKKRRQVYSR